MKPHFRHVMVVMIVLVCLLYGMAGQSAEASSLEFPGAWLNSRPLRLEQLRGKLVLLYFFEESCPRCKKAWPQYLEIAKQYADQPIVFIAVNSGNAPADVNAYVRAVGVGWPVIVDTDRQFEKAAGISPISLQNIMQLAVITPEGRLATGLWNDWPKTIKHHISGARWNVDPKEVPAGLKEAWQEVELGNYSAALPMLAKAKRAKDAASQAGVEKLSAAITSEFSNQMDEAKAAETSGSKWAAYQQYQAIAHNFRALPESKDAKDAEKKLASDPTVAKERKAMLMLRRASQTRAVPGTASERRVTATLRGIVRDYPETEAGKKAAARLPQEE